MLIAIALLLIAISIVIFSKRKRPVLQNLAELEGTNFFCYNNKKDVQEAIEIVLLPQLSSNFEIIFLNGKIPESKYDPILISGLLYRLKQYSKFPHLFKVRNGKIIELSINNAFYNTIDQNKPLSDLITTINNFFLN